MCSPIFSTSRGGAGMVTPLWWPGTRGILGSMICRQGQVQSLRAFSNSGPNALQAHSHSHTCLQSHDNNNPWQHRKCKVQSMHWDPTPGPTKTSYSQPPDSPVLDRRDSRCTWPIPLSGAPGQRQQHQWKSTCCSVPLLEKGEPQNQDQQENPQHTQHSHKA